METLIRRHVLWRLIWVCAVCLCPTKRMLGLYGLSNIILYHFMNHTLSQCLLNYLASFKSLACIHRQNGNQCGSVLFKKKNRLYLCLAGQMDISKQWDLMGHHRMWHNIMIPFLCYQQNVENDKFCDIFPSFRQK